MRTFAIIFTEPSPEAVNRLKSEASPDPYELLPDKAYLVKSVLSSNEIAKLVGIKGEGRNASGVVFRLGTGYAGFTKKALWEWLEDE